MAKVKIWIPEGVTVVWPIDPSTGKKVRKIVKRKGYWKLVEKES